MAFNENSTFASRDVCDLTFCDYATKKPVLYLDYANTTSTSLTGETVYAYGGHGHPKRVGFAGDRGGQITFETQISTMKLLALVSGGELSSTADLLRRKVITATSDGLALPASETVSDAASVVVYPFDDDCGVPVEDTTFASGKITADGLTEGEKYVVYYMTTKTEGVQRVRISGNKMPKEYTIYGYCIQRGEDTVDRAMRMVIYKAMPNPEVELSYSNTGDPQTLSLTMDLEADKEGNLIDYIYLEDDLEE